MQRLPGHWPMPGLHPPVDKEVAAVAALCNPLLPHLQYQSLALQQTTLYVSAQGSLRSLTSSLHHHQRPIAVLLAIIACVFCVILHPVNTKDFSAKIISASSSLDHPRPLEHIQPLASKSKMLAFASPCVRQYMYAHLHLEFAPFSTNRAYIVYSVITNLANVLTLWTLCLLAAVFTSTAYLVYFDKITI